MKYGDNPKVLGLYSVKCPEMMFYQYLPIKMIGEFYKPIYEERLSCFNDLVGAICCDFIGEFGLDEYMASYIYMSAKSLYQSHNCPYNRPGWHCDGFLTTDVNYIWSDKNPTVFNIADFSLTLDDTLSLSEMEAQARPENDISFPNCTLIRLNQYNVHKVSDKQEPGIRTFLKLSFSKDKYDLLGNSHNPFLDYNWEMKERRVERNIPQTITQI